jgi:sporulation protein YlmC with PRC-barrel domain
MAEHPQQDYAGWIGYEVVDRSGEKVGKVNNVFLDDGTGQPEWLSVSGGVFERRPFYVPLQRATVGFGRLTVGWDKVAIKGSPSIDEGDTLSPDDEDILNAYYERFGEVAEPLEPPPSGDGVSMIRSEERSRFSTRRQESGRARLRKYVVTEQVTQTVAVSHEELHVEREAIPDGTGTATMSEGEWEITLYAERPVVDTEVVPVERILLSKETLVTEETVGTEIRKEQVETTTTRSDR